MNLVYTTISKVGLIRNENEDSLGVFKVDNGLLTIVCDGLGGNNAGEIASQLTVDTIYKHFKDSSGDDYNEKIKSSMIVANKVVYEKSTTDSKLNGMSTTAEVLFIKDNKAYIGHIGDSRIYMLNENKLDQLTKDHSFVQKLVDDGLLSEKEAEFHPNRNIITRAIGDGNSIEVDLKIIDFKDKKNIFFFVCTDGVNCVTDNKELEDIFLLNDINSISHNLSDLIEERGAPDNFSFVLIGNAK
jgi:protein phosphatase